MSAMKTIAGEIMKTITGEMPVWVVWVNSDLTEGKGYQYPLAVCACEATAKRLAKKQDVQGTDGDVRKDSRFEIDGQWYGRFNLVNPSREDDAKQALLEKINLVKAKANAAGLTKEEIALLATTV